MSRVIIQAEKSVTSALPHQLWKKSPEDSSFIMENVEMYSKPSTNTHIYFEEEGSRRVLVTHLFFRWYMDEKATFTFFISCHELEEIETIGETTLITADRVVVNSFTSGADVLSVEDEIYTREQLLPAIKEDFYFAQVKMVQELVLKIEVDRLDELESDSE